MSDPNEFLSNPSSVISDVQVVAIIAAILTHGRGGADAATDIDELVENVRTARVLLGLSYTDQDEDQDLD